MDSLEEFEHLKIKLKEIELATNNFDDGMRIGRGGFGQVYKAQLSHFGGPSIVAIKRLDRRLGQGDPEFWKELMMLSQYKHENLISLLGFCDQGQEKLLVYEYASHGSLEDHLRSSTLTCTQRLKICVGAARGLEFLHNPNGTQQRVLHRDIKSSNILLDENWNAKISDFGLSKIGPANQQNTLLVSNAVGTYGYCDPIYMEKGFLTKESDVYSFGVVLFEVLCGRMCFENYNGERRLLVPEWKQKYEQQTLNEILHHTMRDQIVKDCLDTISAIAYKCLLKDRAQRPTMAEVVEQLESALEFQECFEDIEPPNYEDIVKMLEPPLIYGTIEEFNMLLSKGILLNNGKTWFSVNNNGESCELISAAEFSLPRNTPRLKRSNPTSRFSEVPWISTSESFTVKVRTQFLSPGVTYAICLVFQYSTPPPKTRNTLFTEIQYKQATLGDWKACRAYRRRDGWLMAELYHFTSHRKKVVFDISIKVYRAYDFDITHVMLEGIEFHPVDKVKVEAGVMDNLFLSDSNSEWEQTLPSDYLNIIKRSKDEVAYTTKKELYLLLSKGILVKQERNLFHKLCCWFWELEYEWFSLDGEGKRCLMLPSKLVLPEPDDSDGHCSLTWEPFPLFSRFPVVAQVWNFNMYESLQIRYEIDSRTLSPGTRYATYLVYRKPFEDGFDSSLFVKDMNYIDLRPKVVYFMDAQTPVIRLKHDEWSQQGLSTKRKGHQTQRPDRWMEVKIWEFITGFDPSDNISMALELSNTCYYNFEGLMVEGIEFRPI